ncbi:MAG: phosphoglycerate dehydrogenase [Nitrospinae bacterium]|nr:phosphoglycerate dehydrogenase [Nitrospinota bacterium]
MNVARVLVSDKLSETGVKILKQCPAIEVDVKTGLPPEELIKIIPQYDGLVVRSATKVTKEIIEAGARLKVIGRAGIGVDNVDVRAASAKGVVVMNTPGGNNVTTAEHAVSMMMALSRQIPQATASVRAGKWEKNKFMGVELMGKTLGIIGIGRIGSLVVKRARGLEMRVIAYDPFISHEAAEKMGVELVTLDDVYARADFISIHTPKTPETTHLLNADTFKKMKKGVRIINCARGGIIDEAALARAIKDKIVAGAALDVFENEPPEPGNPLIGLEEVIYTPHLGAATAEAQENVALAVAEQFADFFTSGLIRNAVNVPSVDPEQLPVIRPYLWLGERMGSFIAQVAQGGVKEVLIDYFGGLAEIDQRPITQAILKGILTHYVGQSVNMVNAPFLAESRGIVVKATASTQKRNFAALVGLRLVTEKGSVYVEGTVFVGDEPRLVKLEKFLIEAQLDGTLLVVTNTDKPGVIGHIGTFLGDHNINIGAFNLGRAEAGGLAMSIVNIDSAPTQEQLKLLAKVENILDVKLVQI